MLITLSHSDVTDQSEERTALVDLVESGASLLNTMNCLLKNVHTVSKISGSRKCTSTSTYITTVNPLKLTILTIE